MDLTIIIPVYNVGNHLSRCLDSIFVGNTIDGDFEVIAVDDGSSDNSYDILQEYASRHNQLKIYHQENQGSSVARNKALDVATGKYIMFVDSDDFLTANSIQPVVDYIKEKDLDLLFFDYTKISSKGEQECRTCPNLINGKTYSSEDYIRNSQYAGFGSLWSCIYRRSIIEENKIRFYHGIIHQDVDFLMRLFPHAAKLQHLSKNVYNYYYVGESATRTKNVKKIQKNIFSDFIVIDNVTKASKDYSEKIRYTYSCQMNSLFVSLIFTLIRNQKLLSSEFCYKCLQYAKENAFYPIKGRTLSWKTTALIPLINQEWLLRRLL